MNDTLTVNDTRTREERTTATAATKGHIDKYIWGIYAFIIVISLIELYSASSREVSTGNILTPLLRHAGLLGVGCLIMLGFQRLNYTVFKRLTWAIVFASVCAAIYTMFWGDIINGARRSFTILSVSIQPSELLKFSAALMIARVVGYNQTEVNGKPSVKVGAVKFVAIAVLFFGGLLIQQGLTNTILLVSIALSLLLVGGVRWKHFWIVVGCYAVLGGAYYKYSEYKANEAPTTEQVEGMPYQVNRAKVRADRMEYYWASDKYNYKITPENQQAQYSFIAQANGGIVGNGPGNSRETARLPLAFSDYILAIIIEDGGLVAGLVVMTLYLLLLARAGWVGARCQKVYPALLIIGMAIFIVYQALFHMAIVSGLFPVSGQPLPFISKGGSSVLISSMALGIMLSVSRYAARRDEKVTEEEREMADNPIINQ